MIPFIAQPMWRFGPLTISAFGVIVAAAVALGLSLGRARFDARGLDREIGARVATWVLIGGFVGAHVFSVVFYFPRHLAHDPLLLLRIWEDVSSIGGMLGGLLALYFVLRRDNTLNAAQRWEYVGAVAYVFPVALFVGRIACSLAHDHPGRVTTFPLAVSLESNAAQAFIRNVYGAAARPLVLPSSNAATAGFHDLGIYECIYLGVVVVPAIWLLARRRVPPEMFVVSFIVLYMPVRFLLDFLRIADMRYIGLTPAQWVSLAAIAAIPVVVSRAKTARRFAVPTITPPYDGESS